MIITVLPLILVIVGILMFALCTNSKLSEIGRIAFFVGLFFVAWAMAGKVVTIG